jgi:hypothetical protein
MARIMEQDPEWVCHQREVTARKVRLDALLDRYGEFTWPQAEAANPSPQPPTSA